MADVTDVGKLIRELRKALGLSQPALAELIGYPSQRVGEWERGVRPPTWDQARALGRIFKRSAEDFHISRGPSMPLMDPETDDKRGFRYFSSPAEAFSRPWPIPIWSGSEQAFCPHGCLYFDEDFLTRYQLNPIHCVVIEIVDSSMAPALPMGSVCVANRQEANLEEGAIFAFEHEGAPLIRRVTRLNDSWLLRADGVSTLAMHHHREMPTIGMVIWTARWLGKDLRPKPELAIV